MIEVTYDDTGIKQALDTLIELQDIGALKTLAKVIRRPMKRCTDTARNYAPSSTGELKESIRVAVRKPKQGDIVVEAGTVVRRAKIQDELEVVDDQGATIGSVTVKRISDASWRWHWVEFGSVNNRAYGYLRKAWAQESPSFVGEIRDGLENEVNKTLRKMGINP